MLVISAIAGFVIGLAVISMLFGAWLVIEWVMA